jgi:transcriptional regulator with XRE-family HTH domain
MQSADIGNALRLARRAQRLSRFELARRADVSVRLIAEFERGRRPNVSLETALKLLRLLGQSIHVSADAMHDDASAFEARAAVRRATWTAHIASLSETRDPRLA